MNNRGPLMTPEEAASGLITVLLVFILPMLILHYLFT